VLTKPVHHSQKVIAESENGVEISIKVKLNFELEREILGFGAGVKVLSPERLKQNIAGTLRQAVLLYNDEKEVAPSAPQL